MRPRMRTLDENHAQPYAQPRKACSDRYSNCHAQARPTGDRVAALR